MKKLVKSVKRKFGKTELEKKYISLVEESYNLSQTDAGLSDYAAYEANKLFSKILGLQNSVH